MPVLGYPSTRGDVFITSRAFHPDSVGGPVRTQRTPGTGLRGFWSEACWGEGREELERQTEDFSCLLGHVANGQGHCAETVDAEGEVSWAAWRREEVEGMERGELRTWAATYIFTALSEHPWMKSSWSTLMTSNTSRERGWRSSRFLLLLFSVLCTAMAFLLKNKADKIQHITFWKSQLIKMKLEIKCN